MLEDVGFLKYLNLKLKVDGHHEFVLQMTYFEYLGKLVF